MSSTNNLAERDKILDKIQKEIINKKNLLIQIHNDNYRKNTIEDTEYNKYVNWVRHHMSKIIQKGTTDKKYYDKSVSKFILKDSTEFKNPDELLNALHI